MASVRQTRLQPNSTTSREHGSLTAFEPLPSISDSRIKSLAFPPLTCPDRRGKFPRICGGADASETPTRNPGTNHTPDKTAWLTSRINDYQRLK